jgi:hypothetical protein
MSIAAAVALLGLVAHAEDPAPRIIPPELVDRQPAMIDAQVRAISEHSPPGPQGYFLGFAGVGEERVFVQEIQLAEQRLGARFGLADRSLLLVNDQRDLEAYPLASVPALRYALKALGKVMDDDDVLFLALSSHGWKDATIAISNAGLRPDALSATDLAAMLQEAGIRWRVIVVSACYAGSFIKPLADDHTIVLRPRRRTGLHSAVEPTVSSRILAKLSIAMRCRTRPHCAGHSKSPNGQSPCARKPSASGRPIRSPGSVSSWNRSSLP